MTAPRRLQLALLALATLALTLAIACQDNVVTPLPPGIEPFEDGDVPGTLPAPTGEALQTSTSSDGVIRAYGRGLVLAPPSVVWRLAKMPEAMIARCNTDQQIVTPDNDPAHELSFLVHYVVNEFLIIEWDDQWRGDVQAGTADAPELALIKHQKVEGSSFIYVSEGTVELRATEDPAVTELWFVEHLDAISGSTDQVVGGMRDNYAALVELAHDRPIPACR
ncbi:MAG TPA: hypothetical protein VNO30_30840 [Kofleriaceae bacterium]|nr:hypothetical protein [Kofleriaceae bacterium]